MEGQAPDDGQGPDESSNDFGGFNSVEDLVAAHGQTKTQVTELESLKGRQGSELGDLRRQLSESQGYAKGLESKVETKPTITRAEIAAQLNADEITEEEALDMRDELVRSEMRVETRKMIKEDRDEADQERYVRQYMKNNPGYEKAFNDGQLTGDIRDGFTAEHAYDRYKNRQMSEQLDERNKEAETKTKDAQKKGQEEGAKVERQKNKAGKVLSGGSSSTFRDTSQTQQPLSREKQREKAAELISRMRAG